MSRASLIHLVSLYVTGSVLIGSGVLSAHWSAEGVGVDAQGPDTAAQSESLEPDSYLQ